MQLHLQAKSTPQAKFSDLSTPTLQWDKVKQNSEITTNIFLSFLLKKTIIAI